MLLIFMEAGNGELIERGRGFIFALVDWCESLTVD
jgi:hypothetical protein